MNAPLQLPGANGWLYSNVTETMGFYDEGKLRCQVSVTFLAMRACPRKWRWLWHQYKRQATLSQRLNRRG